MNPIDGGEESQETVAAPEAEAPSAPVEGEAETPQA